MAKLRHIAIACDDVEATAKFYEEVFEMERVGETSASLADGVYLSDGVINLPSRLQDRRGRRRRTRQGLCRRDQRRGRQSGGAEKDIEANGGTFFLDLPSTRSPLYEKKYRIRTA